MSRDNSQSACEYKRLAKKLKHDDFEQFQTLVRMHLSFVLDLNIDETDVNAEKTKVRALKWGFVPFSKKRGPEKVVPEGTPLTADVISQVHKLIQFLSTEDSLSQEGIFRRSGKVTRQQELKSLLAQRAGLELDESQFSVHDCASVLKLFLAELPEPLLTEVHYPAYCQIAELCQSENGSSERMLRAIQLLLLLLPSDNRKIMKDLLRLLHLTASHAALNRMSAENLATLFTPHLLCPRKLSPEAFHTNAQNLSCVIVFMIKEGLEVFEVPQTLATDIKAYWDRRRLTPNHLLEQSITEGSAAKTVFSFVDRERTAQENTVNPTETALAQLYAHIQGLPESTKKKRLIKQFNKENGHGTPRTRTLGDSIKRHIFSKSQKGKTHNDMAQMKLIGSSGDELLNSPENYKTPVIIKTKLKFDSDESSRRMPPLKASLGVHLMSGSGEDDEDGESPPKISRVSSALPGSPKGGDDNSSKQKTGRCVVWLKSLSLGEHNVDYEGGLMGRIKQHPAKTATGELYREPRGSLRRVPYKPLPGLPLQSERPDSEPRRPELFQPYRRLRPLDFRRKTPQRLSPLLPRPREPTILDREFWIAPNEERKTGVSDS